MLSFEFSSWIIGFFNSIFISASVLFSVSVSLYNSVSSTRLSFSFPSVLYFYFLGHYSGICFSLSSFSLLLLNCFFVTSLNSLNSLMKFMIVLLKSVSCFHLCISHLANISTRLLGFIREIMAFIFHIVWFFQWKLVRGFFISSVSDMDRADWDWEKDKQAAFGLDVGYGLCGMRSGGHCMLVQALSVRVY